MDHFGERNRNAFELNLTGGRVETEFHAASNRNNEMRWMLDPAGCCLAPDNPPQALVNDWHQTRENDPTEPIRNCNVYVFVSVGFLFSDTFSRFLQANFTDKCRPLHFS